MEPLKPDPQAHPKGPSHPGELNQCQLQIHGDMQNAVNQLTDDEKVQYVAYVRALIATNFPGL